jgi:hypothetical protein
MASPIPVNLTPIQPALSTTPTNVTPGQASYYNSINAAVQQLYTQANSLLSVYNSVSSIASSALATAQAASGTAAAATSGVAAVSGSIAKDLTPPPAPTNFAVSPGISHVVATSDAPTFTMGHGYDHSTIYAAVVLSSSDLSRTFSSAGPMATFQGGVGSFPSDPNTSYRVWLTWTTVDGVESAAAGGPQGLYVETGQDVTGLINALTSQLTSTTASAPLSIRSDEFYIASPSGPTIPQAMPFIVVTTPQVINGQTVPVGVYINQAFIANGTITSAQIGLATIDAANIASVDAGTITTGYLNSARIAANSITASQIDSTGLTIKDLGGNVIFGAGTPVNISNISGLGALASLSQITAANVGTYIANGAIGNAEIGYAAIGTSNIQSASITQALIANAAVGSAQIANAAVGSAQIANAAIGTAQIGTAAVNTLSIAGEAVTFPSSAFAASYTASVTVTLDDNYPVYVIGTLVQSYSSTVYLTRDGGILRAENPAQYTLATMGTVDYPGAGTHTFTYYSSNTANVNGTSIMVLVLKR